MAQPESYNPERNLDLIGMSRRKRNMAEETGPGPEGVVSTREPSATVPGRSYDVAAPEIRIRDWLRSQGVMANALLGDEGRLQAAQESLGTQLTPKQEEAVLDAHQVGSGEPGKDSSKAGVYNYTQAQIREKAEILKEAGFSKEQRRTLLESGLAGTLPPSEFAGFDKNPYKGTPLEAIVEEMVDIGTIAGADEVYLKGITERVQGMVDTGTVSYVQARDLLRVVNRLRITAEQPPAIAQRPQHPRSTFEQIFVNLADAQDRLAAAQRMPQTTPQEIAVRQAAVQKEQTAIQTERNRRDNLLREIDALKGSNGERLNLLSIAIDPLATLYYVSRVRVSRLEKEGRGEYEGRGTLQKLVSLQEVIRDPRILTADRSSRTAQLVQETKIFLGEEQTDLWSDPRIQTMENMLEVVAFKQRWKMRSLAEGIRGSIDYVNREGLSMITKVVENRKSYTPDDPRNPAYPENGLYNLWRGTLRSPSGHVLLDEDNEEIIATNFDDVRDAVEEARRREPWVPNRQDWEAYTRFVADDPEELEEMMPYIVAKVIRKLGTGLPDTLYKKGEQEKERLDAAMANFEVESEAVFRRLKSQLNTNLNSILTYFFSDKVRVDWNPYLQYYNILAEGAENNEQQDHLINALVLDKDGLTMLAAYQFLLDDGIFFRYGQKSANLDKGVRDINKLFRWQMRRKREMTAFLMSHKLRKMNDLLNLTLDQDGNITAWGVPKHPAFQRLKALFDEQDQKDIVGHGHILDVDEQPTDETRWQEYCRKAMEWQRTGKFDDSGEAPRVIFEHPLARSFKRPTKNAAGQPCYEFLDMFEKDQKVGQSFLDSAQKGTRARNATWYERVKRRRVKSNMDRAERLCRNFMLDSAAALARHFCKTQAELDEMNEYLTAAGMEPITIDETVPQKRLYRALMHSLIAYDQTKLPKDRTFKIYDVLTQLLDIDIDVPTSGAWYIGAHDTTRPSLLLAAIDKDNRSGNLKEAMPAPGKDEKNTGAAWAEKERRMGILLQMVMYAKFGKPIINGKAENRYFNFPGHDTKGAERKGAGVKDIRNYLNLLYGTSTGTVWLDDMLKEIGMPLEPELPKNYGATEDVVTELVGLAKGGNEAILAQTGYEGVLENPRDWTSAVQRTATNYGYTKTLTSGNKEGFAVMKDGPFRRMFKWRDYSMSELENKYISDHKGDPFFAINNPLGAITDMKESTYRAGVELAGETCEPLVIAMKGIVESTFGLNPGTAKFARTLLVLGSLKWADTSPEYRSKPGFAVDGNLHLARYFMQTYFLEYSGDIQPYNDQEWDEIMLGYITKPNGKRVIRYEVEASQGPDKTKEYKVNEFESRIDQGQWVSGTVQEGLIDAFPKKLRDFILTPRKVIIRNFRGDVVLGKDHKPLTYDDYVLPFGLNSKYPETFANYYRESQTTQADYRGALTQITSRKKVTRP